MSHLPAPRKPPTPLRIALAAAVGTTIDWYDYLVFGAATVLVFNPLFFPTLDPVTGTLAGFSTLAVAFLARPVGALVFGHFGDRTGRKQMLVLSIVTMGAGTFAVGLLPTYHTIGIWAPILLLILRLAQGFAVGGEWGGAVIISLEHAPPHRRALYASLPQAGVPAGAFLSSGAFFLVTLLPEDDLLSWGWRIPFLCSAVLVAVGLYIRLRLTESPAFLAARERGDVARRPALTLVRSHKRALLAGMFCGMAANTVFYLSAQFLLHHGPAGLGLDRSLVLSALLTAAAVETVTLPLFAHWADRFDTRRVLLGACGVVAVGAFPVFLLFESRLAAGVFLSYLLALPVMHALAYGPVSRFTAELFPVPVRYTGSSVAYHLGGAVTSAPVPIVAALLLTTLGSSVAVAGYLLAAALIGGLATYLAPGYGLRPARPELPAEAELAAPRSG
uniref:MFS transporter n=1 Tax=Paractinoplanes polyasparticus TaxID=2856853 RepID=UPI001C85EF99|nr:MFS transporter [Actinoplanes polyasparticus]